jgi:diguanylate cyclase (GGDEF)-like protein
MWSRTGGDEFAVLLPKATAEDAERVCRWLERSISENVTTPGGRPLETSVGFAPFSENVRSIDEAFSAADASMYAIKAGHSRTPREPAPVG